MENDKKISTKKAVNYCSTANYQLSIVNYQLSIVLLPDAGIVQVNRISMQFVPVLCFGGFYGDVVHLFAGVEQAQC